MAASGNNLKTPEPTNFFNGESKDEIGIIFGYIENADTQGLEESVGIASLGGTANSAFQERIINLVAAQARYQRLKEYADQQQLNIRQVLAKLFHICRLLSDSHAKRALVILDKDDSLYQKRQFFVSVPATHTKNFQHLTVKDLKFLIELLGVNPSEMEARQLEYMLLNTQREIDAQPAGSQDLQSLQSDEQYLLNFLNNCDRAEKIRQIEAEYDRQADDIGAATWQGMFIAGLVTGCILFVPLFFLVAAVLPVGVVVDIKALVAMIFLAGALPGALVAGVIGLVSYCALKIAEQAEIVLVSGVYKPTPGLTLDPKQSNVAPSPEEDPRSALSSSAAMLAEFKGPPVLGGGGPAPSAPELDSLTIAAGATSAAAGATSAAAGATSAAAGATSADVGTTGVDVGATGGRPAQQMSDSFRP